MTGTHRWMPRNLPGELSALTELALDLRWTWSHGGDALWRMVDPEAWELTQNPWAIVQEVGLDRLERLAGEAGFRAELERVLADRRRHAAATGPLHAAPTVAYFCLEFGLAEALPLYAGGLGVLAGDYLKAASDLGAPVIGVGLLYQEGYQRQTIDADGRQRETYPYNDPGHLPLQPVRTADGAWLHVALELPGRRLRLRVWQATVGRVRLLLLDSNDLLNAPADRGVTSKLYGDGPETRLLQELALGVGGWRALRALGLEPEVCHVNEGHAAFAVLERVRSALADRAVGFREAWWATRAGNVFTTHTSVPAAFDRFAPALAGRHLAHALLPGLGLSLGELLGLGRADPRDADEPFGMGTLAVRGCARTNGVSRRHGEVSRAIFAPLFPRWPLREVPVDHVTNGVHVPTWDGAWADQVWTEACGQDRWVGACECPTDGIRALDDRTLWTLRGRQRRDLVTDARRRLARQLAQRGADAVAVAGAERVLDPDALTLGFARRFADYKRMDLLLADPARLARLLADPGRPVQLVVAGKAHARDEVGKARLRAWIEFIEQPEVRGRAVFLEDHDLALAQTLVQGVDVWLNTPRAPLEASGTSGMKVLVNGGLNASVLDGWWAEAWEPGLGWVVPSTGDDRADGLALLELLERDVAPCFHARDAAGLPRRWLERVRASMATLTPRFGSDRMLRDYAERVYAPAAAALRARAAGGRRLAVELAAWEERLERGWSAVRLTGARVRREAERVVAEASLDRGDLRPDDLRVELYADPAPGGEAVRLVMPLAGAVHRVELATDRPAEEFSVRAVAHHPAARVPAEAAWIRWP